MSDEDKVIDYIDNLKDLDCPGIYRTILTTIRDHGSVSKKPSFLIDKLNVILDWLSGDENAIKYYFDYTICKMLSDVLRKQNKLEERCLIIILKMEKHFNDHPNLMGLSETRME